MDIRLNIIPSFFKNSIFCKTFITLWQNSLHFNVPYIWRISSCTCFPLWSAFMYKFLEINMPFWKSSIYIVQVVTIAFDWTFDSITCMMHRQLWGLFLIQVLKSSTLERRKKSSYLKWNRLMSWESGGQFKEEESNTILHSLIHQDWRS